MKLVQKYPLNWNGKATLELTDSKVIVEYQSLWGSNHSEYFLQDISPLVSVNRASNQGWNHIGWFFLMGFWFVLVADDIFFHSIQFLEIGTTICGIGAIASFLLLFLMKYETVVFKNKNNQALIWIKRTKSGEENGFVEALKSKVSA